MAEKPPHSPGGDPRDALTRRMEAQRLAAGGPGEPPSAAEVTAGMRVAGRYQIEERLGEGAFGEVWSARDGSAAESNRALKFLRRELLTDPEERRLFEAEQDALDWLAHTNLVRLLDRGEWQGRPFLVTEYNHGSHSMRAWLREGGHGSLELIASTFAQICSGVAEAHELRIPGPIVHRDLKPENVLFCGRQVKVLDFGLARLCNDPQQGLRTGTDLYAPPEQALGQDERVGPWSDVFSLGVMLHEALTLRPWLAEDEFCWVTVQRAEPGPLLERGKRERPKVPGEIWRVLGRCLQAEGARRYANARVLREALRLAWRGERLLHEEAEPPPEAQGPEAMVCKPGPAPSGWRAAAGSGKKAVLLRQLDGGQGEVFVLPPDGEVTIGRSPDCTIFFDDRLLSRSHARIRGQRGLFLFADNGSRNGSFINGQPSKEPRVLHDGYRIQLGESIRLLFAIVDDAEADTLCAMYARPGGAPR